ncbi:MAG: putative sialic acid transporter [Pseudomonadota bacterium]
MGFFSNRFYGWRVVAAGGVLQFLQAGMLVQSFGAYVAVLSAERGWSKTALSGAAALQSVETALIGPVLGWLIDRFGEARLIRLGVIIFALGLMVLGNVDSLAGFYGAIVMIALGTSLSGYFPINVAIIHWFERKRARALSACGLGLALGGLAVPVIAASMSYFGWRMTAMGSGVLVLLVGLPLVSVFRYRPRDLGLHPDGEAPPAPLSAQAALPPLSPQTSSPAPVLSPGSAALATPASQATSSAQATPVAQAASAAQWPPAKQAASATPGARPEAAISAPLSSPDEHPGFTARQALRTGAFWLLAIGHGVALLVVTGVNVHAITHMKEGLGYTVAQASLVISLMTLAQIGGVLMGVVIGDRFDKRRVAAACMLGHGFGLLMLTYATGPLMLLAFAILHGVAWGLRGPFMQAIRADYFGRRSIGMIMGLSSVIIAVGQVAGPMVAGGMADLTGDYRLGYTVLALIAVAGAFAFLKAKAPQPPQGVRTQRNPM